MTRIDLFVPFFKAQVGPASGQDEALSASR